MTRFTDRRFQIEEKNATVLQNVLIWEGRAAFITVEKTAKSFDVIASNYCNLSTISFLGTRDMRQQKHQRSIFEAACPGFLATHQLASWPRAGAEALRKLQGMQKIRTVSYSSKPQSRNSILERT